MIIALSKSLKQKIVIFVNSLIILFCTGCVSPDISITRNRRIDFSQIHSIAFLPFSGNVGDCAQEANKALEAALLDYFKTRNIKVVQVSPEWVKAMPELADVKEASLENKVPEVGRIFNVDSFISGSICECRYYNPNIGNGLVLLTVNIYDAETGELLAQIDGKKSAKSYDTGSIRQMTGEIVNAMLTPSKFYRITQW